MEMTLHSNLLELRAIRNVCAHFLPLISKTLMKIMTDKIVYMYYIIWHPLANLSSQCMEALKLWNLCLHHNVLISAAYLPQGQKITADSLSHKFSHDHEWEMNPTVLHSIFYQWRTPVIDLFATYLHRKCPFYCCRADLGKHPLKDALLLLGEKTLLYTFPQFPLLLKVLTKKEKANVLLIAPTWPRQTWYPYLMKVAMRPQIPLQPIPYLLSQNEGQTLHPNLQILWLKAWLLHGSKT